MPPHSEFYIKGSVGIIFQKKSMFLKVDLSHKSVDKLGRRNKILSYFTEICIIWLHSQFFFIYCNKKEDGTNSKRF